MNQTSLTTLQRKLKLKKDLMEKSKEDLAGMLAESMFYVIELEENNFPDMNTSKRFDKIPNKDLPFNENGELNHA